MNIRRNLIVSAAVAAALIPAFLYAADIDDIISRLQRRYDSISTVSADFTQKVSSKGAPEPEVSGGRVYFKKPGKMRWLYSGSNRDELVSNGKTVWFFQPDLNQAVERRQDPAVSNISTDFLSGMGSIKKDFTAGFVGEKEGRYIVELTPREGFANLKKLTIGIDKKDYTVVKTEVQDQFGNVTGVTFTDIKVNAPIKDSFFEWTPPKGVGVIRQ